MNAIHENIRQLRTEKDFTQSDVAKELFVSRQLISKWEQGTSLPDIRNLEKLASLFDVSINALIDDESARTLTVKEAFKNRRKAKILWVTLALSLIAIMIGTGAWLNLSGAPDPYASAERTYAVVETRGNKTLYFEVEDETFKWLTDGPVQPTVYDKYGERVYHDAILPGDTVEILYSGDLDEMLEIQIIDSKVDAQLLGVVVTGMDDLGTVDDAIYKDEGVRYAYHPGGGTGRWNVDQTLSSVNEGYVREKIYDIDVKIDPLKVPEDLHVGLLRPEGIDYVDTVDLDSQRTYTYTGEYALEGTVPGDVQSVDVTYNISIHFQYALETFTVYEYDANHQLIDTTILEDWQSMSAFEANDDTLYALVKTVSIRKGGLMNTYEEVKVKELFLGEKTPFPLADDEGFIRGFEFHLD